MISLLSFLAMLISAIVLIPAVLKREPNPNSIGVVQSDAGNRPTLLETPLEFALAVADSPKH